MPKINQTKMAELTGIAPQTIRKRLKDVEPIKGTAGALLYESTTALPILYGLGTDGDRLDPSQEKAQLDKERRLIAELDRKFKEGTMVLVQDVEKTWTDVTIKTKNNLLAVPAKVSIELVGKSDPRQIEEAIKVHVHDALSNLAEGFAPDKWHHRK